MTGSAFHFGAELTSGSSGELWAAIFERNPLAMLVFDDTRRLQAANAAARQLLELAPEDCGVRRLDELLAPRELPQLPLWWREWLVQGSYRGHWQWQRPHGSRYTEVLGVAHVRPGLHVCVLQETAPPLSVTASRAATILVVEDEQAVRDFLRVVLEQAGYVVLTAQDGDEAWELFQADPQRFDLILTDVLMPQRNGPELAAAVQQVRPGMPIVFISGYLGDAASPGSELPLPGPLLEKPFHLDVLLRTVTEALQRRRPDAPGEVAGSGI